MENKYSEIRFGAEAIKKGFVTPDQVINALSIQVSEDLKSGRYKQIGDILRDLKLITELQIKEVLKGKNNLVE